MRQGRARQCWRRCWTLQGWLPGGSFRSLCSASGRTGAGTRAFCAGADLKGNATSSASYAEAFYNVDHSADRGLYVRLVDLTDLGLAKPIVAAINGHCLGAGLEIALQCDLRIASSNASFGLPEAKVGSIPALAGMVARTRSALRQC
jgi:enoyl-CoA hydratase/carnithine racemase